MSEFKGTPGPWHPGHLGSDGKCQCRYVVDEGYAGGICTIHLGNDLAIGEGGNDAPPLDQAIANMHLIAAAPDLLESQTMGIQLNTPDFLDWIAERLVNVYGESPHVDFVVSLKDRASAGRAAIAKALGETK